MPCCSPHKKHNDENHHDHHSQSSCSSSEKKNEHSQSSCCSSENKQKEASSSSCCSTPSKKQAKTVSREMTIEEILGMFPFKAQRLSQEITQAGLSCVGCHAAVWETLEGGMYSHGKTDAQIDELVTRLNALLKEEDDPSSIILTPEAASKFLEILAEEGKEGWGLRFSEELSGCSGYSYVLDFSQKAMPNDKVFVSHGIEIHVSQEHLVGTVIGWKSGLNGSGFVITNNKVRSSCSCGSSHNY